MSAFALAALMLAGPSPRASPTDESVLYEPEVAPEPEPIVVEPPEPEGEAGPEPEQLPLAQPEFVEPTPVEPEFTSPPVPTVAAVVRPPLPPPPPPPNGNGRLVGGSFSLVLGLAASAAVAVEAGREDGNPQFVAATFIPLGLLGIGLGAYLLARGSRARAQFLDWRRYAHRESRPSGDGLLVAGIMSTVVGGITLVAAGVQTRELGGFDNPLVPTLFAVGGVGVLGGVGLITGGMLRRNHYSGWRQSTFLSVMPTIAPSRNGVSVGLVGRF